MTYDPYLKAELKWTEMNVRPSIHDTTLIYFVQLF
jgi:hypothetical protein